VAKFQIESTERFDEEYENWQKIDRKAIRKINQLMMAIQSDPFTGLGQPEPLRFGLSGCWSRRINRAHRLIYRVEAGTVTFLSCRGHYE
jgi:toxin YoeB